MRYYFLLLILLFSFTTYSQSTEVLSTFHGYGDVYYSVNNGVTGKFDLKVVFNGGYSKDGKYVASDLSVGDKIWYDYGLYIVDTIRSVAPPLIEMVVYDSTLTRPKPPLNARVIFTSETPNRDLFVLMRQSIGGSGVTANEFTGLLNHVIMLMDADTTTVGSANSLYNNPDPILKLPVVGEVIPSTTLQEWIDRAFYFTAPTLSIELSPTTIVYEVGDSTQITISGVTTNPSATTLSGGELNVTYPTPTLLSSFGTSATYNSVIQFTPKQGGIGNYNTFEYRFQANQDWTTGAESGNITSSTATIYGVYPILYGASAQDSLGVIAGDPYALFGGDKLVEREGDKTISFTADNEYLYLLVPDTWTDNDFSLILDHNGFNVTNSFKKYTVLVSSSGLTNNWTNVSYTCYQWLLKTDATAYEYEFFR